MCCELLEIVVVVCEWGDIGSGMDDRLVVGKGLQSG